MPWPTGIRSRLLTRPCRRLETRLPRTKLPAQASVNQPNSSAATPITWISRMGPPEKKTLKPAEAQVVAIMRPMNRRSRSTALKPSR